jgi:hypothetical protein
MSENRNQGPPPGASELGQIDLQPGEEHQQEHADFRKKLGDRCRIREGVKAARAEGNPGK